MATVLTITYAGTLLADVITTSPWQCVFSRIPEYGGVPFKPQFELDILQPKNVDGARYRVNGTHYPRFSMSVIIPADSYESAEIIAREIEITRGDKITIAYPNKAQNQAVVIEARALASARRIVGATTKNLSTNQGATAMASVDAELTLQVIAV